MIELLIKPIKHYKILLQLVLYSSLTCNRLSSCCLLSGWHIPVCDIRYMVFISPNTQEKRKHTYLVREFLKKGWCSDIVVWYDVYITRCDVGHHDLLLWCSTMIMASRSAGMILYMIVWHDVMMDTLTFLPPTTMKTIWCTMYLYDTVYGDMTCHDFRYLDLLAVDNGKDITICWYDMIYGNITRYDHGHVDTLAAADDEKI